MSILQYGCTTRTLTKRIEKKFDGNYTRMLRAILNKSWKTIQLRRTRHAGDCWGTKEKLISDVLLWTPSHGWANIERPARTYRQQPCTDTGCSLEDQPEAMNSERVREIRLSSTTWWWWWYIYIYIYIQMAKYLRKYIHILSEIFDHIYIYEFSAFLSILIYGCTSWTLTKRMEKKLDGNYIRKLWAILNKSMRQHHTKQQLYGHQPPITKTIQVRRTIHAGHCWRSKDELISDILLWSPHMGEQRQDYQLEPIYNSTVLIQDIALKTDREQWLIETGGERGSGSSVLAARNDNDDDGVRQRDDIAFPRSPELKSYHKIHKNLIFMILFN